MKTIKEKAFKYAYKHYFNDSECFACEDGYKKGAVEQRKIDIQRACDIHCKLCDNYNPMYVDGVMYVCDYCDKCKAKIQIEQAMKGE